MREVDEHWPDEGAELHHSVGSWPVLIDDTTTVTGCKPLALLSLRARAWPAGEAAVTLELVARGDDTAVTILEDVVRGPGVLMPRPLRTPLLEWRNHETMRRLAYLAERRSS
jgi:hypothetical protein